HQVAHRGISVALDIGLHRVTYVTNAVAFPRLRDSLVKAFFGYVHKPLRLGADFADSKRPSRIAMKAFVKSADVEAHDVAFFENARTGNPVHDFVVDGNAKRRRKPAIAFDGGFGVLA